MKIEIEFEIEQITEDNGMISCFIPKFGIAYSAKKKEDVEKKTTQANVLRQSGKKIERIVIFYSDKSCIEYNPE